MTYLIDISGNQAGLDIALAREAGNEAVVVKAVAAYRPEHTVAEGYHSNVDRTIAAGLPKGHYLVPNSENTPAQSAKFLFDNRYRPADTDIYMLDNEPLDTYKVYWRDDNAAAFFEALHELGIRYDQMWLYCPAALTRAARDWPKIKLLRLKGLKIVWVSYGDSDPYREDGEEPFTGDTGLDNPEVHQFTSTYRIPDYGGNVDRNYSPLPINELFGGPPMYNPWSGYRVTGTWEDHASYSEGGTDWPLPYGSPLRAPASGRLVSNGWVGTAGRRATFYFDAPVRRARPRSTTPMLGGYVEHDCDMVAFVFQHAKGYLGDAHFDQGALVGYSGASASGQDYGGDVHLHGHGQCIHGARVDFMKFVGAATAGDGYTPIEEEDMQVDERAWLYGIYQAIFEGGKSMPDGGRSIGHTLAMLNSDIIRSGSESPADASVRTGNYPKKQDDADTNTMVRAIYSRGAAAIDIDALAAKIAAAVKLPAGGTVDAVAIAKAVRAEFKTNPLS